MMMVRKGRRVLRLFHRLIPVTNVFGISQGNSREDAFDLHISCYCDAITNLSEHVHRKVQVEF